MARARGSRGYGRRKSRLTRMLGFGLPASTRARRIAVGRLLLVGVLVAAVLRLAYVQTFEAPTLSAAAEQQRITKVQIPAQRGTITDRNGTKLAFSVGSDALSVQPKRIRQQWDEAAAKGETDGVSYVQHAHQIAAYLHKRLGDAVDEQDLLNKLLSDSTFVYLDEQVDPAVAKDTVAKFPDIALEQRARREYPNDTVASAILGVANWRKDRNPPGIHGIVGLESALDAKLSGTPGQRLVDTEAGNNSVVIPGTQRDVRKARPGDDVTLTIDTDVQYRVHQLLLEYVHKTQARHGSAVVLDAQTGEVYALTNDNSFNPNDISGVTSQQLSDRAVTTPFEPGSVGKLVTASAAVATGRFGPMTPVQVPSELPVAGSVIHDDWTHPDQVYTVTGVLAKSSNIGADEIAKAVGKRNFMNMLLKMGIGQRTGIALPGETAGHVPPMDKWSGTTFANLPIGQGYSLNLLQMADMYQAIANDGLRVPPRIIKSITKPDGTVVPTPRPKGVRVVTPQQAATVREIISHVAQDNGFDETGTAVPAAVPGYNIAGKTGTPQRIVNGRYSLTRSNTTFVGILPANHPRFVIAVVLYDPPSGEGGDTAAPLFHNIAVYLTQRYHIPVSRTPTKNVPFVLR